MSEHIDTVYHITPINNSRAIAERGLRLKRTRSHRGLHGYIDKIADEARPSEIVAFGISRAKSVYAHTLLENLGNKTLGTQRASAAGKHSAVFAIEVDPDKVLVGDVNWLDTAANVVRRSINEEIPLDTEVVQRFAQRYWETAVTLGEYRRNYDQITGAAIDSSSPRYRYFRSPEVVIPGPIPPEDITWVASIAVARAN